MKHQNTITILVCIIAALSIVATAVGVFSGLGQEPGEPQFQSQRGEAVTLYGKGLYKNDSVSVASQGIAQDIVTMILGVPLLLASLSLARKGSLKGRLLLTGTVSYFLYTYVSYCFLSMYNPMFLVYVVLMSMSLFAFILCIMSIDVEALKHSFKQRLPVKFLGGFQIFIAFTLVMLWLGKIVSALIAGSTPLGLEHYTTLVIQAMDLGIIVPAAVLSGTLLIKRNAFGYLLSSVIIIKALTMLTALTAMIIGQLLMGVKIGIIEIVMFPAFNLIAIYCLTVLIRNIDEKVYRSKVRSYSA